MNAPPAPASRLTLAPANRKRVWCQAAKYLNELVLGDRVHPGAQGLRWVERVSLIVDSQEGLLHEILHLVRQSGRTPPEKRTHVRAHILQERLVGPSVPGESTD
jgi:hypothetical protein